jgi:hypothetical protein
MRGHKNESTDCQNRHRLGAVAINHHAESDIATGQDGRVLKGEVRLRSVQVIRVVHRVTRQVKCNIAPAMENG